MIILHMQVIKDLIERLDIMESTALLRQIATRPDDTNMNSA